MHTLSLREAVCITVLHCSPVIPILLMRSDFDQRLLLTLGPIDGGGSQHTSVNT
jgi:hypothetical protein